MLSWALAALTLVVRVGPSAVYDCSYGQQLWLCVIPRPR
jgi:hypothetical protein